MTPSIPCPAHGHLVTPAAACPACVANQRAGGNRQPGGWWALPPSALAGPAAAAPVRARLNELATVRAGQRTDMPPASVARDLATALLAVLDICDRAPGMYEDIREVVERHFGG